VNSKLLVSLYQAVVDFVKPIRLAVIRLSGWAETPGHRAEVMKRMDAG
jgi:hypothetical protein